LLLQSGHGHWSQPQLVHALRSWRDDTHGFQPRSVCGSSRSAASGSRVVPAFRAWRSGADQAVEREHRSAPHRHLAEDELFTITEGKITFTAGEETRSV
jgi:hypothetical protein